MRLQEMQNELNNLAQGAKIVEFVVEEGQCTLRYKYRRGPVKEMTFIGTQGADNRPISGVIFK